MPRQEQVLLIDADDTLWENNLRYERTLDAFFSLLAPLGHSVDDVRRRVDSAERDRIPWRGYGARHFLETLEDVYVTLAGPRASSKHLEEIRALGRELIETPPVIFDEVPETLGYLAPRHHLVLFTKGNQDEQRHKIKASGLAEFFRDWEIVAEKNAASYRALVERHAFPLHTVWMVGNSPRSDINPARAVGLNAVYIPSQHKWDYEMEEIREGSGELLQLERFQELREHF